MSKNEELRKHIEERAVKLNKPTPEEETPKTKSKTAKQLPHKITALFLDLHKQKFGKEPGGKRVDVEDRMGDFMKRYDLTYKDMVDWSHYLLERKIKGDFKGGYGCLVSDKMIVEWLEKRPTTPQKFQEIAEQAFFSPNKPVNSAFPHHKPDTHTTAPKNRDEYVQRMVERGFTEKEIKVVMDIYDNL